MQPEWRLLEDAIAGPEAVRRAGEHYLLRFEAEGHHEYHRRLHCAPWRPEFVDALRNLTSRPFTREPALNTDAPAEIQQFVTNVDACGNSLGVFARGFFHRAVAFGLGGIMSDFPIVPNTINGQPLTIYDLNQINPRPYWWEVRAQDILALVTDFQDGRERINHLRIRRCRTERDGFAERDV